MQKETLELILNFVKWCLGFLLLVFMLYVYFFKEKFDIAFLGIPFVVMNFPVKDFISLLEQLKNAKPSQ